MDLGKVIENAINIETEDNSKIKFNKIKVFSKIELSQNWDLEIGYVQWGNIEPKFDVRKWNTNGKAGKGITLAEEQFIEFINKVKEIQFIRSDFFWVKKC